MPRTLPAPAPPVRPPDTRTSRPAVPRPAAPPRSRRAAATRSPLGGPAKRLAAGLLVGALAMLGVATLDTIADTSVPVLGSFAALPEAAAEREVVEVPAPPADPGICLNWTRADATDVAVVDCGQAHLFEQAGTVSLADQTALPDERGFRQLVDQRCTPIVLSYLDGRFDPDGRYRVGALKPSPAKWAAGDRDLRCGLQSLSRSGAMFATTGTVATSDQAAVQIPGACLGIDGRTIGDPVPCGVPHAVEAVGIVDLSAKFPEKFPPVEEQDGFLQPECTRIAGEFAGDPNAIAAKKLTVYWDNLGEESWKAGTRRVNCNVAALLPDRSGFAPVTGSVRDANVVISDQPAPPAAKSAEPAPPTVPREQPAPPPSPAEPPPPAGPEGQIPPPPAELPPGTAPVQPPAPGDPQLLPPPDGLLPPPPAPAPPAPAPAEEP